MKNRSLPANYQVVLAGFFAAKVLIHFAVNGRYGLHADELYYIALGKHLQWGYPDISPLVVFIGRFSGWLFGDGTFAYRIIPTLISAWTLYLGGLLCFYLGGKRLAMCITCTATLFSPVILATGYFLQPVVFEQFFWFCGAFLLVRYMQTGKPVFLISFGPVLGFGMMNKYTFLIYFFALAIPFLLAKKLRFAQAWKPLALALILGLLILLPNIVWQARHHFPVFNYLSLVRSRSSFKGAGDYLFQYTFFHGPGMAVWLAGFGYLLLEKSYRPLRFCAWAFILTTVTMLFLQAKIYYAIGAFPVLFAVGGIAWERMFKQLAAFWRPVFFTMLILPVVIAAPVMLPVLSLPVAVKYFKLMSTYTHITQPLRWADGRVRELPQFHADMIGWKELARYVTKAGIILNPSQRKNAVVFAESYPVAGALNYYGRNIPAVVSANNSFAMSSPKKLTADYVIYPAMEKMNIVKNYAKTVKYIGTIHHEFARERGLHVYLLYEPQAILKKKYDTERKAFLGNK